MMLPLSVLHMTVVIPPVAKLELCRLMTVLTHVNSSGIDTLTVGGVVFSVTCTASVAVQPLPHVTVPNGDHCAQHERQGQKNFSRHRQAPRTQRHDDRHRHR